MTITAKVIAHSLSPDHQEIVTLELRYPRIIHAEFMTHRMFSRNASSSRAIPVKKIIQDILDDTAMPVQFGRNQRGMQDAGVHEELIQLPVYAEQTYNDGRTTLHKHDMSFSPEQAWLNARDRAVEVARAFDAAGYHKQVVNRLLEPFSHITVVVTATDWTNFFGLRIHPDADPTMRVLAEAVYDAIKGSRPKHLRWGEWHLPYVTEKEIHSREFDITALIRMSAARCARVSYLTHDGKVPTLDEDLALYQRLAGSQPIHASPLEHPSEPISGRQRVANYCGWRSHRSMVKGENITQFHRHCP